MIEQGHVHVLLWLRLAILYQRRAKTEALNEIDTFPFAYGKDNSYKDLPIQKETM